MTRFTTSLAVLALALLAACSNAPAADAGDAVAAVDDAAVGALRPISLMVPDMTCGLCARPIEKNLEAMGVRDVKTDLETRRVTGRFDPERLTPEAIRARVEEMRFRVSEVRVD